MQDRFEIEPNDAHREFSPAPAAPRGTRWSRLSLLLLAAAVVMGLPLFVEQIQFSITRGQERAKAEIARVRLASMGDAGETFRLVAQSVGPSVVYITTTEDPKTHDGEELDEGSLLFGRRARTGQGSGLIIDEEGFILTNLHVIANSDRITVKLSDGRQITQVRKVGYDHATDLALLKIDASGLMAAEWGKSEALEVGDWVLAVGNPFGLDRSVTAGIVSAKQRRGIVSDTPYEGFVQTDAAVNPGNSGGPLVNLRGEVVGINTAILGATFQGVSFAIPSETARDVYERIRAEGRVVRGFLGVNLRSLTPEQSTELGLETEEGAFVVGVLPGTPAKEAGIQPGDVIIRFDGRDVSSATDLMRIVAKTKVGKRVSVEVNREGNVIEVELTVADKPATL